MEGIKITIKEVNEAVLSLGLFIIHYLFFMLLILFEILPFWSFFVYIGTLFLLYQLSKLRFKVL